MIHICKIYCHSIDLDRVDMLGKEVRGKWLPFAFHMDTVIACKMTTDEKDQDTYKSTTVFTDHNDSYIVDTPYHEFLGVFQSYHSEITTDPDRDLDF